MNWLWWAPLGAAVLHIGEEFVYPGGFAAWDREYRSDIRTSITPGLHVVVNAALLVACLAVALAGAPGGAVVVGGIRLRSVVPPSLAVPCWLGLATLLFSNGIFHLVGTLRTRRISPGLRTGLLLYMPLAILGYWHFLASGRVSPLVAAVCALAGGSYHLWSSMAHRWRAQRREA